MEEINNEPLDGAKHLQDWKIEEVSAKIGSYFTGLQSYGRILGFLFVLLYLLTNNQETKYLETSSKKELLFRISAH